MYQENPFGRDLDEAAMAMDNRPVKERVKEWLIKLLTLKHAGDSAAFKEEGRVDEFLQELQK